MIDSAARKYASLLDRLYQRTKTSKIDWELNASRSPEARLGNYVITLSVGQSGGNPVEFMSLFTEYEELIETINDEELSNLTPQTSRFGSYYSLMEDLRTTAFRQAIGADKALDDLLGALDDDV